MGVPQLPAPTGETAERQQTYQRDDDPDYDTQKIAIRIPAITIPPPSVSPIPLPVSCLTCHRHLPPVRV